MKNALYVLLILAAVSCKGEVSTSSKKCTFNNEPVSCETMDSTSESGTSARKIVSLKASAKTAISYNDETLSILENAFDEAVESVDGNDFNCATEANAGDEFIFSVTGGTSLLLGKNGTYEEYVRIGGEGETILGKWENSTIDDMGTTISTLIISQDFMELQLECNFSL